MSEKITKFLYSKKAKIHHLMMMY